MRVTDPMDNLSDLLATVGQISAYGAFIFAAGYAVRRQIKSDGEIQAVVAAKDGLISAKDGLILQYLAEIKRKDERIMVLEERVRMLESKRE